jgi:hypothetical protein
MFEGFKLTAKEKAAIDGAWHWLVSNTHDEYRSTAYMEYETKGYGNRNDRVPAMAAKGMCIRWFLKGVRVPDMPLRDCYHMRPAAIWFEGMGGHHSGSAANNMPALEAAEAAYMAAFTRMQDADRAGRQAALKQA